MRGNKDSMNRDKTESFVFYAQKGAHKILKGADENMPSRDAHFFV